VALSSQSHSYGSLPLVLHHSSATCLTVLSTSSVTSSATAGAKSSAATSPHKQKNGVGVWEREREGVCVWGGGGISFGGTLSHTQLPTV